MSEPPREFFTGTTLEQAVLLAAQHYGLEPDDLAYERVERRYGFLRQRRNVVIEVDPKARCANTSVGDEQPVHRRARDRRDTPARDPEGLQPAPRSATAVAGARPHAASASATPAGPARWRGQRGPGGRGQRRPGRPARAGRSAATAGSAPRRVRVGWRGGGGEDARRAARSAGGQRRRRRRRGGGRQGGERRPVTRSAMDFVPERRDLPPAEGATPSSRPRRRDSSRRSAGSSSRSRCSRARPSSRSTSRAPIRSSCSRTTAGYCWRSSTAAALDGAAAARRRRRAGGQPGLPRAAGGEPRALAREAAEEVRRRGRPENLQPMNPSDRRIVHLALRTPRRSDREQGRRLLQAHHRSPA